MSQAKDALEQIETARNYTLRLLEDVPEGDWFRQPHEGVTHLAWQLGHLAIGQHALALVRVRGDKPSDAELISPKFIELFGRGSTPDPDPSKYPSIAEIRVTVDRVHARVLAEGATYTDEQLAEPIVKPHRVFTTKIGALRWCAAHEMLHAGQIGLLKRLLGHSAKW